MRFGTTEGNLLAVHSEDFAGLLYEVTGKSRKLTDVMSAVVRYGRDHDNGHRLITPIPAKDCADAHSWRTRQPTWISLEAIEDAHFLPRALKPIRESIMARIRAAMPVTPEPEAPQAEPKADAAPEQEPDSGGHKDHDEPSFKLEIYQPLKGGNPLIIRFDDANETVWATQKQLADVFGVSVKTINEHWNNILIEGELEDRDSTIRKFRIVAEEGKLREIDHGNLDMILAIGFRVNSQKGTEFRRWAYGVLKAHMKGAHPSNDIMALMDQRTAMMDRRIEAGMQQMADMRHEMRQHFMAAPPFDPEALGRMIAQAVTAGIVAAMRETRQSDRPAQQPPESNVRQMHDMRHPGWVTLTRFTKDTQIDGNTVRAFGFAHGMLRRTAENDITSDLRDNSSLIVYCPQEINGRVKPGWCITQRGYHELPHLIRQWMGNKPDEQDQPDFDFSP